MKAIFLWAFFAFCANGMAATFSLSPRPFPHISLAEAYPGIDETWELLAKECGTEDDVIFPQEILGDEESVAGFKLRFFYTGAGKVPLHYKCKGA